MPVKIETLETQGMSIVDSMSVFDETIEKLTCTPGSPEKKSGRNVIWSFVGTPITRP